MNNDSVLLEVNNLAVRYGDAAPSVSDVTFTVRQKEIVVIVGESGSGKTTVIRTILGSLPVQAQVCAGDITLDGQHILNFSAAQWRELHSGPMAMVFQDCGSMMDPIQTIGQQFVEYLQLHRNDLDKKSALEEAEELCRVVSLRNAAELWKRYPFELSGGQRQRVGIALALAHSPKLLLADEPTAALDVTTQAQVARELVAVRDKKDTSIIMVTHNIGLAAYMADKIIVMEKGLVVEAGTPEEILHHPKQAYTQALLEAVPRIGGKRYADNNTCRA